MDEKRILIIDDEEMIVDILRRRFERMGFAVCTAQDGDEGIGVIENNDLDVVLCDIKMPNGASGNEVLRASKSRNPGTRFVAMSGQLMSDVSVRKLLEDGADLFVKKPFPSLQETTEAIIRLVRA
jgi:DNA-binding NtrC family response regulator